MSRKTILDVDPGIDDAFAVSLAVWEPRLDVVAVTATGGNVSPEQATLNVQTIIEQLDPPKWPRLGAAAHDQVVRAEAGQLHGPRGLGDAEFRVAELHHQHRSDKLIVDEVQAAPGEITILALGPLTNIAIALQNDPELAAKIGHLVISGGTLAAPGNITPAAEFNIYCDALAARSVLLSAIPKTLIPLDVSSSLLFGFDFIDQLPDESNRVGSFLRKILPGAMRSHRERLGVEGFFAHDVVALVAALHPGLFRIEAFHIDVETEGMLTHGATVIDRRQHATAESNIDVAVEVDTNGVMDCVLRCLAETK